MIRHLAALARQPGSRRSQRDGSMRLATSEDTDRRGMGGIQRAIHARMFNPRISAPSLPTTKSRSGMASFFSASALLLPLLLATACTADAADADDEDVASDAQELTGSCGASFASCVRSNGGGACAARHCSGACVSEVARCVRGGGGAGCAARCSGSGGSSGSPTCRSRHEWTDVSTSECGFVAPPFEGAIPGRARATCWYDCNGVRTRCDVWHHGNGRAQCTSGIPLDLAGNPW